jgi:hypothetical protein
MVRSVSPWDWEGSGVDDDLSRPVMSFVGSDEPLPLQILILIKKILNARRTSRILFFSTSLEAGTSLEGIGVVETDGIRTDTGLMTPGDAGVRFLQQDFATGHSIMAGNVVGR